MNFLFNQLNSISMKMQKSIFFSTLVFFSLFIPSLSNAQLTAKGGEATMISESTKAMSKGSQNSLSVNLPKVNAKFAEEIWKDFVKQYKGSYKKDKKADEAFVDNAMVGGIGGGNTVDMYMKFAESSDNTAATLWIDLGGAYLNSKDFSDKYAEAEKMLMTYALTVSRKQTENLLKEQEKMQKNQESDLQKLEKKNKSLVEDIEAWKKKITQAEADIQTNLKQQEESKAKIEAQKKVVEEVKKKLSALN
jgi:hypothetical protein